MWKWGVENLNGGLSFQCFTQNIKLAQTETLAVLSWCLNSHLWRCNPTANLPTRETCLSPFPWRSRHLCQEFVRCKEKHPALRPRREGQKYVGWGEAWMEASFKVLNS